MPPKKTKKTQSWTPQAIDVLTPAPLPRSEVFYGADYDATVAGGEEVKTRSIPIGSVKSCMGHAEGASGLVSLVKCLVMYENKKLLPNQKFVKTEHQPLLDGRFAVQTQLEPWCCGNACISNYGFGGTNAFAVRGQRPVKFQQTKPSNSRR